MRSSQGTAEPNRTASEATSRVLRKLLASFPFLIFSETFSFLHTFLKLVIIEHSTMYISLFWISHRAIFKKHRCRKVKLFV